jgi:hypothetical protein
MTVDMSRATKATLTASAVILLLLICNYVFAEHLYPESVQSDDNGINFSFRGSDAAGLFDFPEDRVGGILFIVFIGCLVAFVLQYKNDLADKSGKPDGLSLGSAFREKEKL